MKQSSYSYKLLIPYVLKEKNTIASALICTIFFSIVAPILAWLAGTLAKYTGQGDVKSIVLYAGIAAIVFIFRGIFQYGQDTLMAKASLKVVFDMRVGIYGHLQRLSLNYFQDAKTGDLAYRLTEDVERIGEVIKKFFQQFIPSILQLIVVLGYIIYLNWQLTMATFIVAPLIAILIAWFGNKVLELTRKSQAKVSNISSLITEVFAGIQLVKAFSAENYEIGRLAQEADKNRLNQFSAEKIKALQIAVIFFLELMGFVFLLFLGSWQISKGNMTGTNFISYVTGVVLLIDPISFSTNNYNEFKQHEASVERIFELFAIKPLINEHQDAIELKEIEGIVEYRDVYFGYDDQNLVLQNINLTVKQGEIIALVGSSGAGKSTLVNLLPRFYDVLGGEIFIDNTNIKELRLSNLRNHISIVPQETNLFSGTIAQNIAFGCDHFDLQEVEKAAKIANAHEFVSQFSQGYYTYVGERGINLSGGQRQRIAIARAVFFNPKILILDEATSALDSESEVLVQQALERVMEERTVFVIAHRLATVRKAHRILVLEQGQIVESGNHEELLVQDGKYAKFHAQQFYS